MKIGIFGGTFDPIHNGHMALVKTARDQLFLDKVLFIPNKVQPFKAGKKPASVSHRLNMLKLATEDFEKREISTFEIEREGLSYTYYTLEHVKEIYDTGEIYFILGIDSFLGIEKWWNSEKLLSACTFVIGARPGYDEKNFGEFTDYISLKYGTGIIVLNNKLFDISSSEIRLRLATMADTKDLLPKKVAEYIYSNNLYTGEDYLNRIAPQFSEQRKGHVLNTMEVALKLAKRYGADPHKALTAALFHDLFRGCTSSEIDEIILEKDLPKEYMGKPYLAHGKVASAVIEDTYHIADKDVLNAVSFHTTGRANMTALEKIIFLADLIEPSRSFEGVERLREKAFVDLDEAVLMALENNIDFIKEKGLEIDEDSIRARDFLCNRIKEKKNGE